MNMRLLFLSAVAVGSIGAPASAAPPNQALHFYRAENAADCVDPRTLAELVETYTGPVLGSPASAENSVEGEIERVGPQEFRLRFSVTVARGKPAGQRIVALPAADCRKLDGAIAFVLATALESDLGANALPAELDWLRSEVPAGEALRGELAQEQVPMPPSRPPPAASSSALDPEVTSDEPESADATSSEGLDRGAWELGLAATLGTGVVPSASAGILVSMTRAFGSWFALALQLRANTLLSGFDVAEGYQVDAETYDSALFACAQTSRSAAFGVRSCIGPNIGFFSAHSDDLEAPHTTINTAYGVELKLELRWDVADQFSLTGGGLLGIGFRRPVIDYWSLDGRTQVFRNQAWAIHGVFGLAYTF